MKINIYVLSIILILLSGINWGIVHFKSSLPFFPLGQEQEEAYNFPWPGVLPDKKILYKVKVLRNKIISKIIYSDVKRVEFDLLMADKTLYAAELLMEKGNLSLAKETAFKGENYFSTLVSDYAKVSKEVSKELNERIDRAFEAHQVLIGQFIKVARDEDKQSYKDIDYFSKINYQMILEIRENNKDTE